MIKLVRDVMVTQFQTVSMLDSVQKVIDLVLTSGQDAFPVLDEGVFSGIVTYKELMNTHPNRIVADANVRQCPIAVPDDSIWVAWELFESNETGILLVRDNDEIVGMVERASVGAEIRVYCDPLTGLYNSSYLYHVGEKLLETGREISIIFVDVNDFGMIDKEYGHTVGDMVLRKIAEELKSTVPQDAFLCRYGGDEFAILTEYDAGACKKLSKKLQASISSRDYSKEIRVSIAIGIAGGRREKSRSDNPSFVIENLINLASLASTKAKSIDNKLHIEKYINIESTA